MISKINTIQDVRVFSKLIVKDGLGLGFHPDDDFKKYLSTEGTFYSEEEAELRNKLLDECWELCEKMNEDIYEITSEVIYAETGFSEYRKKFIDAI